jgi:hypothetical protein
VLLPYRAGRFRVTTAELYLALAAGSVNVRPGIGTGVAEPVDKVAVVTA